MSLERSLFPNAPYEPTNREIYLAVKSLAVKSRGGKVTLGEVAQYLEMHQNEDNMTKFQRALSVMNGVVYDHPVGWETVLTLNGTADAILASSDE